MNRLTLLSSIALSAFVLTGAIKTTLAFETSSPSEAAKICENIGRYIAERGEDELWVKLNAPEAEQRRKLIQDRSDALRKVLRKHESISGSPRRLVYDEAKVLKKLRSYMKRVPEYDLPIRTLALLDPPLRRAYSIADPRFYQGPRSSLHVLLSDILAKVISDPDYGKGIVRLSEKLASEFENRKIPERDFLSDWIDSFVAEGISPVKAETMAWNLLGLYGSRGAFFHALADLASGAFPSSRPFMERMSFISEVVSYFDSVKPKGKLYSLPPQVSTECRIGKPYHFWMSAYLAYRLRGEGYSTKESAQAAYTLGMLYEFYSETNGRGSGGFPGFNKVNTPLFSYINNSARLGLAIKAAGSAFGSRSSEAEPLELNFSPIDIDAIFAKSLALATPARNVLTSVPELANPLARHQNLKRMYAADELLEGLFD